MHSLVRMYICLLYNYLSHLFSDLFFYNLLRCSSLRLVPFFAVCYFLSQNLLNIYQLALCLRYGIIVNRLLRYQNKVMIMKYLIADKIFQILNVSTTIIIYILSQLSRLNTTNIKISVNLICHVALNQIYEVYCNKSYNLGKVCSG